MRFTTKQKILREVYWNNKSKFIQKFLWLPLNIDGEIRWLEEVIIEYRADYHYNFLFINDRHYYLKPFRFIDNDKY
jgi:hypothetical protein